MGEDIFFERFHQAYRRFYSPKSILRRFMLPPQKRWPRKILNNLQLRLRLKDQQALVGET